MDLTIQHASDVEAQDDDIIVLGVASAETKGGGSNTGEPMGQYNQPCIADE